MTDTPTPPEPGQPLWGDDLNAYLLSLEARIASNEALFATAGGRIDAVESSVTDLDERVSALDGRVAAVESKPEYIFNSYSWQYTNSGPPPTGNQVRFDNADLTLATMAIFRLIDNDGADRTPLFQRLVDGSQLYIGDWDNAAVNHHFRVTGPANIATSDVTVPIEWVDGNGTIPNAKVNVGFLVPVTL